MHFRSFAKASSMLIDFAVDGHDLIVRFTGGKAYRVDGAAMRADEFANAESAGKFYNAELKNAYSVARAPELDA